MKTQYYTAASLDGFIATLDDSLEWLLIVQVGSVTLGAGKPLLPRAITSPTLRLISARAVGPALPSCATPSRGRAETGVNLEIVSSRTAGEPLWE